MGHQHQLAQPHPQTADPHYVQEKSTMASPDGMILQPMDYSYDAYGDEYEYLPDSQMMY